MSVRGDGMGTRGLQTLHAVSAVIPHAVHG